MTNAKFRIKNGLEILEVADDSGTITLLDGEVISDSTLTVFPSATSGTNTAGNDMIVQGGAGTGSGAGGDIKFNVAVASGGSGATGVNPQETKMQIASTGIVTMTDGTNATSTTTGTLIVTGGVGISQNLYAGGAARFTAGTASSSTTTGALVVTGGTGISEDLYVGADAYITDNLSLTSDDAVLNFGTHSDVSLTHVADVGLQLSTTATSGAVPVFEIYQDESDANGGVLRFKKEAGDAGTGESADNDKLGVIEFYGDDSADVQNNFGTIEGRIQDASNDDELGRLMLRPRADSGTAGGIIIDGLTVEGLLNKKHHITVSVGGNRSGSATGYVESSAGGVISLFQAPADNSDKGAQHFAGNGSGAVNAYTVIPAVNIGGGGVPRTFSATARASGSASNYTTNLLVNGTGYTEARISSVLAQKESYLHPGLGSALVLETVDDDNFNGVYFSRDTSNALSWIDQDMSSDLATEGTWGAGWLTEGTDFSIGFHAAKYDSCAIQEAGTTQLNPLVSGKSLFRITTSGHVGIKGAPSSTATMQVYATGETNVGAVIGLESGSAEPNSTTHRLYNTGGNLYWNGTNLSAGSATNIGDLGDVSFSSSILTITSLNAFVFANDADNSISVAATTGTTAGKPLTISAGSSATASNNVNGGDLVLASGGGDGTGTSSIQFKTKVSGTDAAAERMRIHTDGNVGIGEAAPGTLLQLSGANAYLTLQNTTNENGEGGAETKIIFEDHANASLGQIEASHSGTSDDTKGKMILSTHNGTALTAALTISDTQLATFAGDVTISGNDLTFGNGATIVNTDANTLTITEATTAFSGDIKVGGNDIKASDGTTAITLSGANVTVAGNLTVSGTTTAVNTTNMTVEDALIELGIVNGAAPSSDTSWDSGMLVNYYSSSAAKKAGFYWDSSTTAWSLSEVVTEGGSQVLTPTAGATEMRYLYDATNYHSIGVAANGATTLATVDSDGAAAHLTLDADGDIILDADGANITFKDAGTTIADFVLSSTNVTLDSVGDITLDVADGKDVILHEAGTIYASIGQGSVDIADIAESTATTIDTFDCTTYQATKYLILVEDTTNTNYLSSEILVLGDENGGSAVGYLTQYAVLYNNTELGEFTVTGSSNNINLRYTAGNMSGTSQHKVRVVAQRIASI
jgi:hypothetical protein